MRKALAIIQIITFVIMILFVVNLGAKVLNQDIADKVFCAALIVSYGFEAIILYYEAHKYKTAEEPPIKFLPFDSFDNSQDFIEYKHKNNILIERAKKWQLRHDKIQKQYMQYDATVKLSVALLFLFWWIF